MPAFLPTNPRAPLTEKAATQPVQTTVPKLATTTTSAARPTVTAPTSTSLATAARPAATTTVAPRATTTTTATQPAAARPVAPTATTAPRQQTGVTANGTPIYAPVTTSTQPAARPTAAPAPSATTTVLAGRGTGINPATGERYTPQEIANLAQFPDGSYPINPQTGRPYTSAEFAAQGNATQGAYDAARAADLAWQQQHYPAMYAANQALTNPDGSRQGTWVPNPSNPSDDPNTWIWQPYVADPNWLTNGNTGEGPFSTTNTPTGPGIQGGVMQSQFGGVDMTQPGAAEQFLYDNAWRYSLPNADTEQGAWWAQNMGQLAQPGTAEVVFDAVAPGLLNEGNGENYVRALTGTYGPGSFPNGTVASSNYANSITDTYGPGNYPTGTAASADYAAQNADRGSPGVTNRNEEWLQQFKTAMPDIAEDPGLGTYYDNARRKASEDINRQMAARGMWGSSAAGDMIGERMVDLGAEQANREAQYNLDRLAEQRQWQSLGGTLSNSADSSSRSASDDERNWMTDIGSLLRSGDDVTSRNADQERGWVTDIGDLIRSGDDVTARAGESERNWVGTMGNLGLEADNSARARTQALLSASTDAQRAELERLGFGRDTAQGIDQSELQRLSAGQDAASAAQAAQRQRAQDYFQNTMGMGGAMEGVMSGQYNPMITEDKVLLDDILAMLTGSGAERLAGAQRQTAGAQQSQNSAQSMALTLLMMGLL